MGSSLRVRHFFLVFVLLVSVQANALLPLLPNRKPQLGIRSTSNISTYQIGAEWGKRPVTLAQLAQESDVFQKTARGTAAFNGGTAFYLGKFNGAHVMATNYHVLDMAWGCYGAKAQFTVMGRSYSCETFLGSWSDVDFALFTIRVPAGDEAQLAQVAQNMAFDRAVYKGQQLLTIGYGVGGNPGGRLMANQDSDCKIFSEDEDIRYIPDPDDLSPGTYEVWSYANGCDVSHGDSGSVMVDRITGDRVGIIWTGRVPKDPKIQDAAVVDRIFTEGAPEVWNQLSYGAPATKIFEVLSASVASGKPTAATATVRAVLGL